MNETVRQCPRCKRAAVRLIFDGRSTKHCILIAVTLCLVFAGCHNASAARTREINAKLEAARYELTLREAQMAELKKVIDEEVARAGTETRLPNGSYIHHIGVTKVMADRRRALEETILSTRVRIRELEVLLKQE